MVAVVDPPAEVVEARRDDGDREDVLHRRRERVLAAGDAGLVRHEADVDQPHQHDGEEVELLAEDDAVEAQALRRRGVLEVSTWAIRKSTSGAQRIPAGPVVTMGTDVHTSGASAECRIAT